MQLWRSVNYILNLVSKGKYGGGVVFFCFWGFFFLVFWFFLLRLKYYRRGDSMSEGLEWIQLSNIQRSGNIWACVVVIFLSILNIFLSQAILRPELNVPQPVSKWRHRNEICFLLCVIELHSIFFHCHAYFS